MTTSYRHSALAGITKASQSAGDEWNDYALGFVRDYLEQNETLFTDDLWKSGLHDPGSKRALGAVLKKAAHNGWMREQTANGGIVARKSESSHGTLKCVWKSELYKK